VFPPFPLVLDSRREGMYSDFHAQKRMLLFLLMVEGVVSVGISLVLDSILTSIRKN